MQDKLQELTDRLFNEGLSKGKQEGEEILAKARKEAEDILSDARAKAEAIKAEAERQAADMKAKAEGDLKLASVQAIAVTRQQIEDMLIAKISDKDIQSALTSADFVKTLVLTVAKSFTSSEQDPEELSVILPESMRKEMNAFAESELAKTLGTGVSVSFSKGISGGFTIGPKDGRYFISFTDETFRALISEYLRPVTRKFLFGE